MKWRTGTVWLAVVLVCLLGGCAQKEANEIRIGVNAELTGSKPTVGDSCKKAMELLVEQVNQGAE